MDYKTFQPHPDLSAIVKFYWTLEVPFNADNQKQKIIPDGCMEMTFNLADPIKRYTSESNFVTNKSAMVMGQLTKPVYIEPVGNVKSFAICFYPHGFANFLNTPLKDLTDTETPISELFDTTTAQKLEQDIINAKNTKERIHIIETFLLHKLNTKETIDTIVTSTINSLLETKGNTKITAILKHNPSQRRQLERKFSSKIGISPKQLGRIIRFQTALKMLLDQKNDNLTHIAYESEYFDQAHFTKDFKAFTGITPKDFLNNENMQLSTLFYK